LKESPFTLKEPIHERKEFPFTLKEPIHERKESPFTPKEPIHERKESPFTPKEPIHERKESSFTLPEQVHKRKESSFTLPIAFRLLLRCIWSQKEPFGSPKERSRRPPVTVQSLPNRFRPLRIVAGRPRDPFRALAIAVGSRRRRSFSFRRRFQVATEGGSVAWEEFR